MRLKLATLLVVLGVSAALAQAWPALPTTGFVSSRTATDKDVAAGNAVFVLKAYGVYFGKALDIVIPQYAYPVSYTHLDVYKRQASVGC